MKSSENNIIVEAESVEISESSTTPSPSSKNSLPELDRADQKQREGQDQTGHDSGYRLSVRTPAQILSQTFSSEDIFLGDGVIARGQSAAILGPPGVGKSRLMTQLASCCITSKPFLGLPVNGKGQKWLFLQAENSNRRLHSDLGKQRGAFTDAEWSNLSEKMLFHTLEKPSDERLRLCDSKNADVIAKCLLDNMPDIIVLDPLNAFAVGSLNNDEGMLATLEQISQLAKAINPDVTIILVHHTVTGRDGIRKAVGPDRASYGRGSKALYGSVRGAINIAPGDPADTRKIMVACGKNSNGVDFEPLGAVLNPETMLYETDPTFDLEKWHQHYSGAKPGSLKVSPQKVAALVQYRSLKKVALVSEIIAEYGVQKTKAYEAVSEAENSTIILDPATRLFRAIKVPA